MSVSLLIQEADGPSPIRIELRGGAMVEVGAGWESVSRGSSYTALGAKQGISVVTGMTWGETEMALNLDAAFLRASDITVENAPQLFSPEDLQALFERIQSRGRECLVSVAHLGRRGILRSVKPAPGRGYTVDFTSGQEGAPGVNLALVLKWEWSGNGDPLSRLTQTVSIPDTLGALGKVDAGLGKALALGKDLSPDLLTRLKAGVSRMRAAVASLRSTLRQVGDIARAPADLANGAIAAARSLGNVVRDFETILHDTGDEYLAAGKGASALFKAKRAKKAASEASQDAAGACAAVFDAFARRKPTTVGVRPGQSLSQIAAKYLGRADRWPEIAALNQITGQVVPKATFVLDLPPRGA